MTRILLALFIGLASSVGVARARAGAGKAAGTRHRQRRLRGRRAADRRQRCRAGRADLAGRGLRRHRRARSRRRNAAKVVPRFCPEGAGSRTEHRGLRLSCGLWRATDRRELFRSGGRQDRPRHRRSGRRHPAVGLHAPAVGASAQGQRDRARRRARQSVCQGRPAARRRPGAGRAGRKDAGRLQRGAGHRRAGRCAALRRLCAGACGNDPRRRAVAAGSVRSRPSARQRHDQGRPTAVGCAKDRHFLRVLRAPAGCAAGPARCQPARQADPRLRRQGCLRRGARARHAAGLRRLPAGVPERSVVPSRVRAIVAARREAIVWRRTYRTDTPPAYWSYLDRYPRGPHAADARRRLAILSAALEPPPSYAAIEYDVPPPPPDEIVYIDRPVLYFDDPVFAFAPPPPPPVYFLPPPEPEFVVLPPPPPPIGVFVLPVPVFVAMPLYVRPPVYVRPPPNNIIFANIHNRTVINNVINNRNPAPAQQFGGAARTGGQQVATPTPSVAPSLPPAAAQRANLVQPSPQPGGGQAVLSQVLAASRQRRPRPRPRRARRPTPPQHGPIPAVPPSPRRPPPVRMRCRAPMDSRCQRLRPRPPRRRRRMQPNLRAQEPSHHQLPSP